ncbi:MAG: NADH-quinone oxidoreductase subunit L [Pirellulales bacterium]|nr:NADH-quinone oxidoreductase subunit L [Pirellulales bacterium]
MDINILLPRLLAAAWLLPLASFAGIVFFGPRLGKGGKGSGYVATGAILLAFVLSATALVLWLSHSPLPLGEGQGVRADLPVTGPHPNPLPMGEGTKAISGDWYALGALGDLKITIGYYIDALTLAMFVMVSLVASCIHIYSFGYMHEELHEVTDPLVTLKNGETLRRRGRFHRFFQYFSLFCFSMLGLVLAGNVAMVFVFWELVGICSYLLIGFYHERRSASNAGNKAFIVNRVGDFGMIVGLMVLWTGLGTFSFSEIFNQVRPAENQHQLQVPEGLVRYAARAEIAGIVRQAPDLETAEKQIAEQVPLWREKGFGYGWLVLAGLGIFCGCVGKSAQFPLHVWLPDAMEGPTPVSALIHAATMVAAGVYLAGRFFPVFTPEVLLVIAYVGCITLFLAATMALVATDIKRVLAYSTVSQLGYMMFALGLGGWIAGLFHLFTHACFKALLFLCSGSVIHACGTNEMPQMGGLLKKMPYTAWTMLVGCLAIAGAGVPFILGGIGLSGFYSKDCIIAMGMVHKEANPLHGWLFYVAVIGAGMTSFYMFRLWFMTFSGKPRDAHVHEHAHESPRSMVVPLVILAFLSVVAAWNLPSTRWGLEPLLRQAYPAGAETGNAAGAIWKTVAIPAESASHDHAVHGQATLYALGMALAGFLVALAYYGLRLLDPERLRRTFAPLYWVFINKWGFDRLYGWLFVRGSLVAAWATAAVDRYVIDGLADNSARAVALCARLDDWFDRRVVDRLIDRLAGFTYAAGLRLRRLQTGNVRQYVMLLAVGTVVLFMLMSFYVRSVFK